MGFQRLTPIRSAHEDDPELSAAIDAFVVGLGEWIDALQDGHAEGDLARVAERAGEHAELARRLGYPGLGEAALAVAFSARADDEEGSRKAIADLTEIVQRVRLGHRSAA
jgi:hypothetical protein